jgi:hypothetical protein
MLVRGDMTTASLAKETEIEITGQEAKAGAEVDHLGHVGDRRSA